VLNPLFPLLRQHFGVSDAQLGSLPMVLLVVLAFASIPLATSPIASTSRKSSLRACSSGVSPPLPAASLPPFLPLRRPRLVGIGEAAYAPRAVPDFRFLLPPQPRHGAIRVRLRHDSWRRLRSGARCIMEHATAGSTPSSSSVSLESSQAVRLKLKELPGVLARKPSALESFFAYRFRGHDRRGHLHHVLQRFFRRLGIDYAMNYKNFSLKEAALSWPLSPAFFRIGSALRGILCGPSPEAVEVRPNPGHRCAFLAATPFLLLAIQSDEKWKVLSGFFVAMYFMSWYHGPTTACSTILPRSAPRHAIGVYMFATQLLGALGRC